MRIFRELATSKDLLATITPNTIVTHKFVTSRKMMLNPYLLAYEELLSSILEKNGRNASS